MIRNPCSRATRGCTFFHVLGALLQVATGQADASEFFRPHRSVFSEKDPVPAPFPNSFQIDFVTNITWLDERRRQNELEEELDGSNAIRNSTWISGCLYYDWTRKMQRIDHGPGSHECSHFYNHDGPCSLIFIPDWGMYRKLLPKDPVPPKKQKRDNGIGMMDVGDEELSPSLDCCLDIPNIGTPPPDWAERGKPTYNGIVKDPFSNLSAHEWIYDRVADGKEHRHGFTTSSRSLSGPQVRNGNRVTPPLYDAPAEQFHTFRQVVDGEFAGRPLLFTFPSAGGTQDYHYFVASMKVDAMDSRIFALPDGCQTQFCKCERHGGLAGCQNG